MLANRSFKSSDIGMISSELHTICDYLLVRIEVFGNFKSDRARLFNAECMACCGYRWICHDRGEFELRHNKLLEMKMIAICGKAVHH